MRRVSGFQAQSANAHLATFKATSSWRCAQVVGRREAPAPRQLKSKGTKSWRLDRRRIPPSWHTPLLGSTNHILRSAAALPPNLRPFQTCTHVPFALDRRRHHQTNSLCVCRLTPPQSCSGLPTQSNPNEALQGQTTCRIYVPVCLTRQGYHSGISAGFPPGAVLPLIVVDLHPHPLPLQPQALRQLRWPVAVALPANPFELQSTKTWRRGLKSAQAKPVKRERPNSCLCTMWWFVQGASGPGALQGHADVFGSTLCEETLYGFPTCGASRASTGPIPSSPPECRSAGWELVGCVVSCPLAWQEGGTRPLSRGYQCRWLGSALCHLRAPGACGISRSRSSPYWLRSWACTARGTGGCS